MAGSAIPSIPAAQAAAFGVSLSSANDPLRSFKFLEFSAIDGAMKRDPTKLSEKGKELTRREWREFGVYYRSDESTCEWHLHGNREGFGQLAGYIEAFAKGRCQEDEQAHEHLGPHWYLTLEGWHVPRLDKRGIWGTPDDLERIATMIRAGTNRAQDGSSVCIGEEYASNAEYVLVMHVEPDSFDAASLDPQLK